MPYPTDHKAKTRAKIVESARALFNRNGFEQVTIDQVMAHAGLTRGGFYHHFPSKEALYGEAVASITGCSPFSREVARGRAQGLERDPDDLAHLLVDMYLADEMLARVDDQCPLYALSNDVARAGRGPRAEYTKIIERMAAVLGGSRVDDGRALGALAACVGGMVLARTTHDRPLANRLRVAARAAAHAILGPEKKKRSRVAPAAPRSSPRYTPKGTADVERAAPERRPARLDGHRADDVAPRAPPRSPALRPRARAAGAR